MQAATFKINGEAGEKASLPDQLFGGEPANKAAAQAVRVYLFNQRLAHAKTKTRSEVAKTTAKMYKQKGTGRARHGSYSAPIFVGGGIALGPTGEQNYKRRLPKGVGRAAIKGLLAEKAAAKLVVVIEGADKASGKTKDNQALWQKISPDGKSLLIVTAGGQQKYARSWRNMSKVKVVAAETLNSYSIAQSQTIAFTKEALEEVKKNYVD